MLNSLIIILREVLEAAVIISVLLVSLQVTRLKNSWVILSVLVGLVASVFLASQFAEISNAFDGMGQEVSNAVMLFTVAILLPTYLFMLNQYHYQHQYGRTNFDPHLKIILLIIIAIAVMREGVEIIIYVNGYIANLSDSLPLFVGGSIGAWIGFSIGIIIYYSILLCSSKLQFLIITSLTAIVSAGMISEGLSYLIQADWIESGRALWDSSSIIAESSIIGQLLYALFAYEATPVAIQVTGYGLMLGIHFLLALYGKGANSRSEESE